MIGLLTIIDDRWNIHGLMEHSGDINDMSMESRGCYHGKNTWYVGCDHPTIMIRITYNG
mgnify:CR=1 FL=1